MITKQEVFERWTSPTARPLFKGNLISDDGCRCAQGDILHLCGWTDEQLWEAHPWQADREVAAQLGISVLHSVLLRQVNDSRDGQPERCLLAEEVPEYGLELLGPQHAELFALGRAIDTLTHSQREQLAAVRVAAWYAAWYAAGVAARAAARAAAWAAAGVAARDGVGGVVGNAVGAFVVRDLIGQHGFTQKHYDTLTRPWRTVIGKLHADDADMKEQA